MNLVEELVKVYEEEEWWHRTRLSREEAIKYFQRLLDKGRIITLVENDVLLGYVESWRLDFEQFGRLIAGASFSSYLEDVESGPVCYLANTWIRKEFRDGATYKHLKKLFFKQNFGADYFVGEARRKSCAPLKVFTRQAFIEKHIKKEEE